MTTTKERKVRSRPAPRKTTTVLKLTFEEAVTVKLARVCKDFATLTWKHEGRTMTSVYGITKAFGLGSLRDYVQIVGAIEFLGEDFGFYTEKHLAPSDNGPIHIPKEFMENETPLVYLDRVEEVITYALPRKGPKRLERFKSMY